MAILCSDIVTRCQASLDSEDSEFWIWDRDFRPAIQSAQDFIIGIINPLLGNKKFSEDIFADVTYARVFQASLYSRIRLAPADLGHDVWTLLSIEPMPDTTPTFTPVLLLDNQSRYRGDLTPLSTTSAAMRLNAEEWAKNAKNPFAEGHILEAGEQATSYAYINLTNYTSSGYTFAGVQTEIEIRPSVALNPTTIRYAKVPSKPVNPTDYIEFPVSVMNIMVQATLAFLSVKIGDKTTLEQLSMQFMGMILSE